MIAAVYVTVSEVVTFRCKRCGVTWTRKLVAGSRRGRKMGGSDREVKEWKLVAERRAREKLRKLKTVELGIPRLCATCAQTQFLGAQRRILTKCRLTWLLPLLDPSSPYHKPAIYALLLLVLVLLVGTFAMFWQQGLL